MDYPTTTAASEDALKKGKFSPNDPFNGQDVIAATLPASSEDPDASATDYSTDGVAIAPTVSFTPQYITGIRLFTVMGAVTLVVFLMLLDTAILATAVSASVSYSLFPKTTYLIIISL